MDDKAKRVTVDYETSVSASGEVSFVRVEHDATQYGKDFNYRWPSTDAPNTDPTLSIFHSVIPSKTRKEDKH